MDLISRDELEEKLERGDDIKLVMVLEEWHFRAMHIPGSIQIPATRIGSSGLDLQDEIIVYCAHEDCPASMVAYNRLKSLGYGKVRRYAGGVFEWEQAGYPVEGDMVNSRNLGNLGNGNP
ncbi:MAG: rhodanese-like domain-containing protein [Dehalococcoidia bacterium]